MQTVSRYGRIDLPASKGCDQAHIVTPSGQVETALTFDYLPTRLVYDAHGYERDEVTGEVCRRFRYTPTETGVHRYEAGAEQGEFECLPSDHPGYVQVSARDRRYFATSDGRCFVPIGLNTCILRYDALPAGREHFATGDGKACTGMISYRRWLKNLRENGGNYIRLWLSTPYFQARTELPGVHDLAVFNRLDAVMELARAYGIRVKLCLDHFRSFRDVGPIFTKRLIDPDTGKPLTDMEEWLTSEKWNARYLEDIRPYVARYQNDPAVFAWEAWNEMNCLDARPEHIDAFAVRTMRAVRAWSPRNMVANSLGSYDEQGFIERMRAYRDTPEYDFATVHRYLDQGAGMEICRTDPVALAADGIERLRCEDKPVVLNETGAVNDRHTGPFRFYCCDHDGLIFHDVTYTPFFAGAAACGHIWHWEYYVDPQNLWRHFRPFAEMLEGIEVDREHFAPVARHTDRLYVFALEGDRHMLIYVRNRADRWDHALRDGVETAPIKGATLPFSGRAVETWWLMNERRAPARLTPDGIELPAFTHGCVLRVER